MELPEELWLHIVGNKFVIFTKLFTLNKMLHNYLDKIKPSFIKYYNVYFAIDTRRRDDKILCIAYEPELLCVKYNGNNFMINTNMDRELYVDRACNYHMSSDGLHMIYGNYKEPKNKITFTYFHNSSILSIYFLGTLRYVIYKKEVYDTKVNYSSQVSHETQQLAELVVDQLNCKKNFAIIMLMCSKDDVVHAIMIGADVM